MGKIAQEIFADFGVSVQPSECEKIITISLTFGGFSINMTMQEADISFLFLITYFSYFYLFFPTIRGQMHRLPSYCFFLFVSHTIPTDRRALLADVRSCDGLYMESEDSCTHRKIKPGYFAEMGM